MTADPMGERPTGSSADELSRLVGSFEERVWDPLDQNFVDLSAPFDTKTTPVMPMGWFPDLRIPIAGILSETQRVRLSNEIIRWQLSGILHGEQAAAILCRKFCAEFVDPVARTYAAKQAREEERHEAAFSLYICARWDRPYPVGQAFGRFLEYLIATEHLSHKVVGMSVLVEGFAMGALSNIRAHTNDRVLANMLSLVLRDEAVHHNFGTLWLREYAARCSPQDWSQLQQFAMRGFNVLRVNLLSIRQRREVYNCVDLDWQHVRAEIQSQRRKGSNRPGQEEAINPLQVVAASLERSKLIPTYDRLQLRYWLD